MKDSIAQSIESGAASAAANPIHPVTASSELLDTGTGREAERGEAAPASALPCQYNDNCIQERKSRHSRLALLSPNQKTIRHKLILAIEWMVAKYGLEHVGLLTLSFGVPGTGKGSYETWELRQKAKVWEFVQDRWHSLRTNVVAERYPDWACVFELHRDGVWHIHVPVVTQEDIRTGTDIETLSNYKLPYWMRRGKHLRNEALAAEWTFLRQTCCRYRFGRVSDGTIRAKCLDGSVAREVIGSKWAFQVNRLLESLQLATGDKLNAAYVERDLLSRELQRLAGREWCKAVENPAKVVLLGEAFTWREWNEWKASFPKAGAGGHANKS